MKETPGKGFVLTMNLVLPGLGQIVSGRWIAGGTILLLALIFFGIGVYYALHPLFAMLRDLLDGTGDGTEYRVELSKVLICFGLVVLIWIIGLVDGFRNTKQQKDDGQ